MGKRGPKAEPTALKLVNGTRRSRIQPRRPASGTYDRAPTPPKWLSAEARACWLRLARDLTKSARLNPDNLESFAILCEAYSRHQRAMRVLNDPDTEWFIEGPGGRIVRHPAMLEAKEAAGIALRYGQEFGLTPDSAGSLRLPPAADDETAARLLS